METAKIAQVKYKEALDQLEEKSKLWENYEKDYSSLNEVLSTLPDKTRHDVMIPVSKVAFFPGSLIHTNEFLVLLGNNTFVERSAKQTMEIIDRRLDYVQDKKNDVEKKADELREKLGLANEILAPSLNEDGEEIKEIIETIEPLENYEINQKRVAHKPTYDLDSNYTNSLNKPTAVKKEKASPPTETAPTPSQRSNKPSQDKAFGFSVIERDFDDMSITEKNVTEMQPKKTDLTPERNEQAEASAPPARVSRFKASRRG